jgi:hypothetical protein
VDGVEKIPAGSIESSNDVVRNLREQMRSKVPAKAVAAPKAFEKPIQNPLEIPPDQTIVAKVEHAPKAVVPGRKHLGQYAAAFIALTVFGLAAIWNANCAYGPEMYGQAGMVPAADASSKNLNYAVFDLNLNIRQLREEQIKRMPKAHDVVLLGASHWQEGERSVAPGIDFFNSHIHRDYWEDLLGMVNLYVKYDRLPKKLIISIRDNQFKPVEVRKDFLWEPGIPSYHEMAARLGIEPQPIYKTLPYDRMRALLSMPMLFENLTRWHNATERPGPTTENRFETLDVLLPDGSIRWSKQRLKLFSQERALAESMAFVEARRNDPPVVDQQGVEAFEKVLVLLKEKGVEVSLIKPPFNPIYYDAVQQGTYAEGLKNIEKLINDIAARHGLKVYGSYNPHDIGCDASMYIDAEHSNVTCLTKVFAPFVADYFGTAGST